MYTRIKEHCTHITKRPNLNMYRFYYTACLGNPKLHSRPILNYRNCDQFNVNNINVRNIPTPRCRCITLLRYFAMHRHYACADTQRHVHGNFLRGRPGPLFLTLSSAALGSTSLSAFLITRLPYLVLHLARHFS